DFIDILPHLGLEPRPCRPGFSRFKELDRALSAHHLPRNRVELEHRMLARSALQYARIDELIDRIGKVLARNLLQQSVGRELVMTPTANTIIAGAGQNIDHMLDPKVLFHSRDA